MNENVRNAWFERMKALDSYLKVCPTCKGMVEVAEDELDLDLHCYGECFPDKNETKEKKG